MSRVPWGRTTWLVPLLLFAAVLLVAGLAFNLAHLDTGGESLPGVPANPTPAPSAQGVFAFDPFTIAILLIVFFALVLVVALFALRRQSAVRGKREVTRWDYLGTLISLGLTLLVLLAWPRVTRASLSNNTTAANGTPGFVSPAAPSLAGIPASWFLAAAVFAALLVIGLVVRSHAILRVPHRPTTPPRREAIAAVDEALQDLRLGSGVREVILACFQRFCTLLGRRGIPEQDNLTPRELEGLAVARLQVPAEAAASLTFLFEEARYSEHTLDDADRQRAVESLETLRAALEA